MIRWLSKVFRPSAVKAAEGSYRPGPWEVSGGWLPASWGAWNFWQNGYDPLPFGAGSAIVQACVGAYAETIAMCPGDHWRTLENGGRERVTASSLTRILKRPNSYQSISDFLLNCTRELLEDGNAFALAVRNGRGEIQELHLMRSRSCSGRIAQDGSIFYALAGNEVVDRMFAPGTLSAVPQRDVLHVRLHCRRNPLIGETPLLAAVMDTGLSSTMKRQQMAFFQNGGRPSAVLSTDLTLDANQVMDLRARWEEQSKDMATGGVPILTSGIKPVPWSQNSVDSQLAEILKISDQAVALVYRIPLAILGIGGQTYSSTEALMRQWHASGLGFMLNHIEESIGNLFELRGQPDEYLEFNTSALLRSSFKERIEGLAKATIGGIMSPNEARREEGLPSVGPDGEEPRVQQQVVPLSAAGKIPAAPGPPAAPPAPANDDEDEPPAEGDEEENTDGGRSWRQLLGEAARRHHVAG